MEDIHDEVNTNKEKSNQIFIIIEKWFAILNENIESISRIIKMVDSIASGSFNRLRIQYINAMKYIKKEFLFPNIDDDTEERVESINNFYKIYVNFATIWDKIEIATRAVLDKNLIHTVVNSMFSSGTRLLITATAKAAQLRNKSIIKINEYNDELNEILICRITEFNEANLHRIQEFYDNVPNKPLSLTKIHTLILQRFSNSGIDISALIEKNLAIIMKLPIDTLQSIQGTEIEQKKMHPIQAMGLTFNFVESAAEEVSPDSAAVIINTTLPNAYYATRFNIHPLISIQHAKKYGSIASTSSGLNYNLVRRFRTMEQYSIGNKQAGITYNDLPYGSAMTIVKTNDGGLSYQEMHNIDNVPLNSIGSGPRPRLAEYNNILNSLFSCDENPRSPFIPNCQDILNNFDIYLNSGGNNNYKMDESNIKNELLQNLKDIIKVKGIENIYSDKELLSIMLPKAGYDSTPSYIEKSISIIFNDITDNIFLTISSSKNPIIRSPRQELMITTIGEINRISNALRNRINKAISRTERRQITKTSPMSLSEFLYFAKMVFNNALTPERKKIVEKASSIDPNFTFKLFLLSTTN